ncbi:SMI1/KNR4 family protein [Roseateles sp.]|uniref:SMI1/KNR4 family protein n=1 Tax=Roseateles sp. TaxID=1971397 RepID=UPI003266F77E
MGLAEAMSEIERILTTGASARDEGVAGVLPREVEDAEAALGFTFPASYREFIALGGLAELRFRHRALAPSEIVENQRYVDGERLVVFADNGSGDFYCWTRSETGEPPVFFSDHETRACTPAAVSFTAWLAENRF